MNSTASKKKIKSAKLQAVIVEHILVFCIKESSFYELIFETQRIFRLSHTTIKKYLFYLISYELVSYDGRKQVYMTEDGGFDLLHAIKREKKMTMVNSEDIVITIE